MKKNQIFQSFILLFFLSANTLLGQTNVSGSVNGTWNSSGNPYNVTGNVAVNIGDSLVINSGVEIYFQGDYSIEINGYLAVQGAIGDSVLFTIGGTATEFDGIRILNNADDNSFISYAIIEYGAVEGVGDERFGGGILCNAASPTISNCTVRNNSALSGGGICLYNSAAIVEDCNVYNNSSTYAAGIYIRGNATVRRNRIYSNTSVQSGGGLNILQSYSPTVVNNLIYNNESTNSGGGGVGCLNSNTGLIINNVIYNNTCAVDGGGIYVDDSGTDVDCSNNILWGNSATGDGDQIYVEDGNIDVDFCDVDGGAGGTGSNLGTVTYGSNNINSPPNFISATTYDFHINQNSPCIDAGTSTSAPSTDFDENPTNQDGDNDASNAYDMGAFEFLQEVHSFSSSAQTSYSLNTFEGSPTTIALITLTGYSSGSGDITVNCFTKSFPLDAPTGSKSVHRWYRISETGNLDYSDNSALRLYYSTDEFNLSGLASESNLTLWKYETGVWVNKGGTVSTTSNYVEITGLSQSEISGDWAFADVNDSPLPVSLISLTAIGKNNRIYLQWTTASEIENLGFIIQKSYEKETEYIEIDSYVDNYELRGAGNSSNQNTYEYIDFNVTNGQKYWYKLIDVSFNGIKTEHGPIYAISSKSVLKIVDSELPLTFDLKQNYPNPFNPITTIRFDLPDTQNEISEVSIAIYDLLGRKVKTLYYGQIEPGSYEIKWDGLSDTRQTVPSGVYIYHLISNQRYFKSRKMILMK